MSIKDLIEVGVSALRAFTFEFIARDGLFDGLPELHNGKSAKDIIRKRILGRFNEKAQNFDTPIKAKLVPFKALFGLPPWITMDQWLHIQLRGRSVDDLFVLNLDHIVPLSVAESLEELIILVSWQNTRLVDPAINTEKGSHFDAENTLLMERLLGRKIDVNWDGAQGRIITPEERERMNPIWRDRSTKPRQQEPVIEQREPHRAYEPDFTPRRNIDNRERASKIFTKTQNAPSNNKNKKRKR